MSEILNLTPRRDRSGRGPSSFLPLKETMLTHRQYTYFYILSCATLNKTFTAKYDGILPRTPQVRPKSEIYTPKRDNEHPHPFHMRSQPPLPGASACCKLSKLILKYHRYNIFLSKNHNIGKQFSAMENVSCNYTSL